MRYAISWIFKDRPIRIYIYTMNAGTRQPHGIAMMALFMYFYRLSARVSRSICLREPQWRWTAALPSWWRKWIPDVLFLSEQLVQQFVE
jgi:hypothetical protein